MLTELLLRNRICKDSNWPLAMYLAGPRGQAAGVHSIAIAFVGLFLITDY